jgi:hypothetical protein
MLPSDVDMGDAAVAYPERDTNRLVVLQVDLRGEGELTVAQALLQLRQERQDVALHGTLAMRRDASTKGCARICGFR